MGFGSSASDRAYPPDTRRYFQTEVKNAGASWLAPRISLQLGLCGSIQESQSACRYIFLACMNGCMTSGIEYNMRVAIAAPRDGYKL